MSPCINCTEPPKHTSTAHPHHPHPHTDLCLLRSKWCRLYWLCNGWKPMEWWNCSTVHIGRGDTSLWGNLQRPLEGEWNTMSALFKYTYPYIHTPIPTSHTYTQMCNTHTDLRYYWLECRMLRDRWSCSTGHMGKECTNLWGTNTLSIGRRVQYMQEPALSTDTNTHTHVHRSTYILALCLVGIIIRISKWKWGLGTRLHPRPDTNTPISMDIYNTHTQTCVRWDSGGPISTGCWKEEGWGTPTCGGTCRDHWEEGRLRQYFRLTVMWHLHVLLYLALYSACDAWLTRQDQTNIGNHKWTTATQ